jgi:hypothetical protein
MALAHSMLNIIINCQYLNIYERRQRMKCFKKNYFNIVELALAIAIVAVGLTSIVSLVPISVKTGSNTKASYYTSDIADSINAYVTRKLASDFELLGDLPESKPVTTLVNTDNWIQSGEGNVYIIDKDDDTINDENGIYGIKMASGDQGDITDIAGEIQIWRSRVGNTTVGNNDSVDIGSNKLAGINVEVSAPLAKPYEERNKHRFYFETFNRDPITRYMQEEDFVTLIEDNGSDENDEIIERDTPGEITINKNAKLKITIVASELCAGSSHAPVYVRVSVKEPGNTGPDGDLHTCFTGNTCLLSMYNLDTGYGNYATSLDELEIVALPGETWEFDVPAGSTYKIWSAYWQYPSYARYENQTTSGWQRVNRRWRWVSGTTSIVDRGSNRIENEYWSTNENQVLTLINGDNPPEFNPDRRQLTPEECIQDYINENGLVTLNENQVLYLFELSHTNISHTGFDMQDMIVLAEITEN